MSLTGQCGCGVNRNALTVTYCNYSKSADTPAQARFPVIFLSGASHLWRAFFSSQRGIGTKIITQPSGNKFPTKVNPKKRKNCNRYDGSLMIFLMILPHMILPISPGFTRSKLRGTASCPAKGGRIQAKSCGAKS
jgi:hypothetical protein